MLRAGLPAHFFAEPRYVIARRGGVPVARYATGARPGDSDVAGPLDDANARRQSQVRNPSLRPSAIIIWATRTTFQVSARVEGRKELAAGRIVRLRPPHRLRGDSTARPITHS